MSKVMFKIFIYIILVFFLILAVYPLIHTLMTSFKSLEEYVDNKIFRPKAVYSEKLSLCTCRREYDQILY